MIEAEKITNQNSDLAKAAERSIDFPFLERSWSYSDGAASDLLREAGLMSAKAIAGMKRFMAKMTRRTPEPQTVLNYCVIKSINTATRKAANTKEYS